jgi:hypothetical protein
MKKRYLALGYHLMDSLPKALPKARFGERGKQELRHIDLLQDLTICLRKWGKKPLYIVLCNQTQVLWELDLNLIVEKESRFTWYLKRPTNSTSRQVLQNRLTFAKKVPVEYRQAVRFIKDSFDPGSVVLRVGYCLCEQSSQKEMEKQFGGIVRAVWAAHANS